MRNITVLSLLAAMACSTAAFAAPAPAAAAKSDRACAPEATAGAAYTLDADEVNGLRGSYKLSNGDTLKIWAVRSKLFANVGGVKTELVPVSGTEFVSRDCATRLEFEPMAFATGLKLTSRK